MLNNLFSTSASTSSEESTLTMESFQKMIDEFFPILLYGTAEFVKLGELYHCKETDLSPEYIVCNPNDLEQIKKLLPNRRLVHIKDEPQEKVIERMKRLLTKRVPDVGYCACPPSVPRYDAGDGWKCHWCHRPRK